MDHSEYEALRDRLFEAMWELIPPMERQIEHDDWIPKDVVVPVLAELRAFGLLIPREYGGVGLTAQQYVPILVELSKIHGGLRGFVHAHNSACHMFSEIASAALKDELLPLAARGERSFGMGITEPDHGTGADIGTRAERVDGGYAITGEKWLTTNSDWVSHFIVFAKTAPDLGAQGISAILVDRDNPGLTIEPLPPVLGTRGCEHGHLHFADARVPDDFLLGNEGEGLGAMESGMEVSRVFVAASSLGTVQRALELSLKRANERITFGQPIGKRQAVQRYLAEMAMDEQALRLMLYDAAERIDLGERIPAQASLCKLFGLEAACRVTDRALLVFGGIGFTQQYPIERLLRDARANVVEEGPPTVQYLVAARALLSEAAAAATVLRDS